MPTRDGLENTYARALYRPAGLTDDAHKRPLVAIVNSASELAAGHVHLGELTEHIRQGIAENGCVGLMINTVAACDGICQGAGRYHASGDGYQAVSANGCRRAKGPPGWVDLALWLCGIHLRGECK